MPVPRSGVLGINVEDRLGTGERRHGRLRNERTEQPRESLMLGLVEMALAAEKDDPMAQQGIPDRGHGRGRQIAGQLYTMDLCTDRWRDLAHIEGGISGVIRTRR